MAKVDRYRDLEIWQMAMAVATEIHRLTKDFPAPELYGLTSQMRRAAVSIPSNIAEGFMRRSRREFAQFLSVAKGSIAELETQSTLARNFGYLSDEDHDRLLEQLDHLSRKITLFRQRVVG
jgi:four helix bundle protein